MNGLPYISNAGEALTALKIARNSLASGD